MHALAVAETELERIESSTRHLGGEAGTVFRVLEREEDGRPPVLPAKLGHLAFDPERRQPREPDRDALVERGHRIDLATLNLHGLDLHQADARGWGLEQDLGGRLEAAAAARQLHGTMQVGV